MRAAWYERQGPADEVLEVGEMPDPVAGPGEVRVRVHASGVNPSDVKRRAVGRWPMDHPRVIPNTDGAGVVDQVGEGVSEGWLGKRIWLYNGQRLGRAFGTAADFIALDADLITELPEHLSFAEGVCLGVPAMTAHRCVFADGPVTGLTVMVTGGAGAVGHYAIQLAKWDGATVITTVSGDEKARHAKAAGADHVVNYRTEDVAERVMQITAGAGVDRIVEVDFGGNLAVTLKTLKLNGSIAAYASAGDEQPKLPFYALMSRNALIRLVTLNNMPIEARRQAQRDVTRWTHEAKGNHPIAARFPLDRIAEAHRTVESGAKIGQVVVDIVPE